MAIIVILAGSWFGYRQLSDKGCTGQFKLSVAAATEIAPARGAGGAAVDHRRGEMSRAPAWR
jgi:hypothetical protein